MTTSPASSDILTTALHAAHREADAKLVPFAGWDMPLDYGSILNEARTVRTSAGVFDVSHMGRFWFRGPNAAAELDHALGAAMADQPVGKARYSLLLTEKGGILDDLITYRTGEEEYFMVVNASNRERDRETIRARLDTTTLEDVTLDGGGILALQGPESRSMLSALAGGREDFCTGFLDLAQLPTPDFGTLFVARTGYTGEHGYEIFAESTSIRAVWSRLLELGVRPVGLGARDVLRLEAALPLYGHEINEEVNPFEAGLRFGVKGWKTRDFVGGDALRALGPPQRRLVGLFGEKRVPRQGYSLQVGGETVGTVCSGVWSATLDRPIATAWLANDDVDGALIASARGREIPVESVSLPFVPHRNRD